MSLTYNKGEWSELYVLLRLMGEGKLPRGDVHLGGDDIQEYTVRQALKSYKSGSDKYVRDDGEVTIFHDEMEIARINVEVFSDRANDLYEEISKGTGSTFELSSSLQADLIEIHSRKVKADGVDKADIQLKIVDPYTGTQPNLGFSIKSQIGSPSPLINTSKLTSFIFKLTGNISEQLVQEINAISGPKKIQRRFARLREVSSLSFEKVRGDCYHNNIRMVDADLESILAESLVIYFSGEARKVTEIVSILNERNPCGYAQVKEHPYYEYKLKRFLVEHALGMIPKQPWTGVYHATGGYIVVKKDGKLFSYHLMHKNLFETYLFESVKFDTGSSTVSDFGYVYQEGAEYYFALNLMMKFIV